MNNIKLQGIDVAGIEKEYSLNDFKGQKVILYFYPKDNTSGCTQEACDFRDNINRLTSFATVIGVSPDSIKSHLKFKEKQRLNFVLLSDPEHKLAEAFNVWVEKSMYGRKYMGIERSTFVLDENLNIIKEWCNQSRFMSTAMNQKATDKYAQKILWKIKVPAGTKGASIESFNIEREAEAEFLLQRGSDLLIKNAKFNSKKRIWEIDVVMDQININIDKGLNNVKMKVGV